MARPLRRPGNLPAETTSFIGRRREIAELRKRLATARLVTLVGPGGVGKTRLAIRIATDLRRGFRDGAWLVELADVKVPELVANAVLAALDLRDQVATEPRDLLLAYLGDRELLLVVDNCEHLLTEASLLVAEVLAAAPGVRVVATSREPMSLPGEHVLPVPPLELPREEGDEPLGQLRSNESVGLFIERAAAASGRFELTASNRAAVVDLCRRLDGLPLALELAAVRTRVLSVEQIDDRLADRFGLLTRGDRAGLPRHQALRTAVEWSHDLLGPDERDLFRRLAVFAGRFTLEDVEAVCASEEVPVARTLDVLASLLDKSLVLRAEAPGHACYRLHETMREFAAIKLRESGEEDAVETLRAEHYASRCRQSATGARQGLVTWLEWMEIEIDNIRSVLRRCVIHHDTARGMNLAADLRWFWATRATTEGIRWLDQLLAIGADDSEACARVQYLRGFLAVLLVDPLAAMPALERAAELDREAGRAGPLATSLSMASIAANMDGDRATARRLLGEARRVSEGLDDVPVELALLQARSLDGLFAGDLEVVTAASSEGVRLSREIGDLYTLKVWLLNLGSAALIGGHFQASRPLLAEALRIAHQVDDRVQLAYLLAASGCLAAASGQARPASLLLGAGEAVRAGAGARVMPFLAPLVDRAQASAIATLGSARFEAAFSAGGQMSRDAAVRLALGEPAEAAAVATSESGDAGVLSTRERQVAELVADGLTNKEIGARLFISEHTVDSHVRGILNKLGFDSRARVAAWVTATRQ
jgi:predicted ATPase/DNA-binding CsgD family transcriptional regulator